MQNIVVVFAALAIMADGVDCQLIGYAIPSLMKRMGGNEG